MEQKQIDEIRARNEECRPVRKIDVSALLDEIERLQKERDAAVKGIHRVWVNCADGVTCTFKSAVTGMPDCQGCDEFVWRGPQQEGE